MNLFALACAKSLVLCSFVLSGSLAFAFESSEPIPALPDYSLTPNSLYKGNLLGGNSALRDSDCVLKTTSEAKPLLDETQVTIEEKGKSTLEISLSIFKNGKDILTSIFEGQQLAGSLREFDIVNRDGATFPRLERRFGTTSTFLSQDNDGNTYEISYSFSLRKGKLTDVQFSKSKMVPNGDGTYNRLSHFKDYILRCYFDSFPTSGFGPGE